MFKNITNSYSSAIILIILLLAFFIPKFSLGYEDTEGPWRAIEVNLFFDGANLYFDNKQQQPFQITIVDSFSTSKKDTFIIKVISVDGEELGIFPFDPVNGNSNFRIGSTKAIIPYMPTTDHLDFFDSNKNQILNLAIKSRAFCLENDTCEPEFGENKDNCPKDCALAVATALPIVTTTLSPSPTTVPGNSAAKSILPAIISALIFIILGFVILWLVIRKRRPSNSNNREEF